MKYLYIITTLFLSCDLNVSDQNPLLNFSKPFEYINRAKLKVEFLNYHIENHTSSSGPILYQSSEFNLTQKDRGYLFTAKPLIFADERPIIGDIERLDHHTQYNFLVSYDEYIVLDADSLIFDFNIRVINSNPDFDKAPELPGAYDYYTTYEYKRLKYLLEGELEYTEIGIDSVHRVLNDGRKYKFKWEFGLKSGRNIWNRTFPTYKYNEARYTINISIDGLYL